MVPKVIHCFWAEGPKTKLAEKCLASWRKFAPDYEIREWSLSNLSDLSNLPNFFRGAVAARNWAFASDVIRFAALREFGGVYLDFDQELVRPIEDLMKGEWCAGERLVSGGVGCAPGAGIALEKGSPLAQAMLDYYAAHDFSDKRTVGEILEGLEGLRGLEVLDPEVMSPIGVDGKMHRTERTVGIHWYAMSWASPQRRIAKWLSWHGMRPLVDFLLRLKP